MNRRLDIGMDCVKSLERDEGGVRPVGLFQGGRRSVPGGGGPGRVRSRVPCRCAMRRKRISERPGEPGVKNGDAENLQPQGSGKQTNGIVA